MPLTRHAYPVLQLAKFWFLTYVYVVDPGAELWPDKIVGLRLVLPCYNQPEIQVIILLNFSACMEI